MPGVRPARYRSPIAVLSVPVVLLFELLWCQWCVCGTGPVCFVLLSCCVIAAVLSMVLIIVRCLPVFPVNCHN